MGASRPGANRSAAAFPGPRVLAAALLASLIVVYWPALGGQRLWDDEAHLTAPALRSIPGLFRIWFEVGATQQYYPLLHSFFWLEHRLWGDWMPGYHLVCVALHAANALLVYTVLRRLAISAPAAALAALVWALHPVMVESVAWITEQKNTLSGLFYLGSLLAWLKFDDSRAPRDYVAAFALFALGLLCKTVTATLPGAILVILWWKRGTLSFRRDVRPLLPWFVLGAAAGLFTAWVERHLIGAQGSPYESSVVQRILLAGRIVWFYLGQLVWPAELIFIYPRWTITPGTGWPWIFPAGVVILAGWLWRLRHRHRGALAGFGYFVLTLFPVLGFLDVYPFQYSYVADHFQYLASLGVLVPLSVATAHALARLPAPQRSAGRAACGALLLVLGGLSWKESHHYRSLETLFGSVVERNPECWMAHVHLGTLRQTEGRADEAMAHFETAAALNPDYFGVHLDIGNLLLLQNRAAPAVQAYERALRLNPDDGLTHYSMAAALIRLGRWTEAIDHYERALRLGLDPALEPLARLGLGMALASAQRPLEAIPILEEVLARRPDDPEAHCGLAHLLLAQGENGRAAGHFEKALRSRPDYPEALNGLAWIRATDGVEGADAAEAVRMARRATELAGNQNPYYLDTLAAALANAGSFAEATRTARTALELARAQGRADLAVEIGTRLARYQVNEKPTASPGDR